MSRLSETRSFAGILLAAVFLLPVFAGSGCGPKGKSSESGVLVEGGRETDTRYNEGEALPAPPTADPSAPGAAYLAVLEAKLQPQWAGFLEDCRSRRAPAHELNNTQLHASVEFLVAASGLVLEHSLQTRSGNSDFDEAAIEVARSVGVLPKPDSDWVSDDGRVHILWHFYRDVRQAGAANANLQLLELPLAEAIPRLLRLGKIAGAAKRLVSAGANSYPTKEIWTRVVELSLTSGNPKEITLALQVATQGKLPGFLETAQSLLLSSDDKVASAAVGYVSRLRPGGGALGDLLSNEKASIGARIRAGEELLAAGKSQTVEKLVQDWAQSGKETDVSIRLLAILPPSSANAKILATLVKEKKNSQEQRSLAARALGLYASKDASASKALLSVLQEGEDVVVRRAAMRALGRAAAAGVKSRPGYWRALELSRSKDEDLQGLAVETAFFLDQKRFAKELVRFRKSSKLPVRRALVKIAQKTRGAGSISEIQKWAQDEDVEIRLLAVEAVAENPSPEYVSILSSLSGDTNVELRLAVAKALPIEQLSSLSRDTSSKVRELVLERQWSKMPADASLRSLLEEIASRPGRRQEQLGLIGAWSKAKNKGK